MKKHLFLSVIMMLMLVFCIPAFAQDQIFYVTRDGVHIFEEKSTDSVPYLTMYAGDQVTVDLDMSSSKWAAVRLAGSFPDYGWMKMKYLSGVMPSSICNHQWSDWMVYTQPTCTQSGMRVRSCPICGLGESQDIEPTGHNYGDWVVVRTATCTSEGERVRTCRTCGSEEWGTIERSPHSYGIWTVTRQATCTQEGEQVHTCSVCGTQERQTVAMLPHSFSSWTVEREATCSMAGEQSHKCIVCGYEEKEAIATLPHTLEESILEEVTDHSAGVRAYVCKVCGYITEQESFDPEGTLRRGDRSDEVKEMQQLLADQKYLNADGADGIFGGGTEQALMKFQNEEGLSPDGIAWPQTLKRLQHEFGDWEIAEKPTRDTAGERVRTCKDCGFEQHETIDPSPLLERGRRAEDVRAAQQMITVLGFDAGTDDGIYGQKLDNAYEAFAQKNKLDFEPGKILPSQIDALVNAWIASIKDEDWKGKGTVDSPVDLALTVYSDEEQPQEDEIVSYDWTLTNIGDQECVFTALLLNFGEDPDFRENNVVAVLDGQELKANCGNSLSGKITVDRSWGEGELHVCALGVSEQDGSKWLSNSYSNSNS